MCRLMDDLRLWSSQFGAQTGGESIGKGSL
nr:MAG TPA: hypothetical protein [Caudoviricetes sp.]